MILYIGKSRGPSPDRVEDRLVPGRIPFSCIKYGAFIRKSKKKGALYIMKGNNALILTNI